MSYHVKNPDGSPNCGDPVLDELMRAEADRIGGWIEQDDATVVYESPAFLAARAEAEK